MVIFGEKPASSWPTLAMAIKKRPCGRFEGLPVASAEGVVCDGISAAF